jgi:hypothetical protein
MFNVTMTESPTQAAKPPSVAVSVDKVDALEINVLSPTPTESSEDTAD